MAEMETEYDKILYEEEVPQERKEIEDVVTCSRHEIGLLLVSIAKTIVEALNVGVKIVVDVEPIQYESALSLLSTAVFCSEYWKNVLTVKDKMTGRYISLDLSMYVQKNTRNINVVFDRERKKEDIQEKIDVVLSRANLIYFIVASRPLEITFSSALYKHNLILESVKKVLTILDMKYGKNTSDYREKIRYVGRVPHTVSLLMPADIVKSVAKLWTPPPPANADYLYERPRPLDELILPQSFKEILGQYIKVLREENRGSMMLIGLHGSGRKTIARSIAMELDMPAYIISVANILSRYVGESESKLKAFFDSLRARGGLAVFEAVETLFMKTTGENVTPNLRNILYQEMAREDNNFIMVFTTTEDAPQEVFDSPIIGEVKIVVPLPDKEERQRFARMFLREIAGQNWPQLVSVVKKLTGRGDEEAEAVLYTTYADIFVDPTIGFTPGEIYQVMRIVMEPVIPEIIRRERLIDIGNMVTKYTKRDLSARQAKIKQLIDRAIALGWFDVAEHLEKLNNEITRVVMAIEKKRER